MHHERAAAPSLELLCAGTRRGRSRSALNRAVHTGELKRLRPGVFVGAEQWAGARLSERHRAFTAAVGLTSSSVVFCGVTALSLYGVPLLSWPRQVHCRTRHQSRVGVHQTGVLSVRAQFPLKPAALSRRAAQVQVRSGELPLPHRDVAVPGVTFEDGSPVCVKVEPLPYVLVDTLPSMTRQEAIVALDAVLAGNYEYGVSVSDADLRSAETILTERRSAPWRKLREFADPRSESPGESRSRVLFDELGFHAPELQVELNLVGVGRVRVDFWWEDLVCEFDGMIKYTRQLSGVSAEEVVKQEKLREDALRMHGYRVVRISWRDLDHPEALARKLLLAGAPHRAATWTAAG
jgi:hypothetical protein